MATYPCSRRPHLRYSSNSCSTCAGKAVPSAARCALNSGSMLMAVGKRTRDGTGVYQSMLRIYVREALLIRVLVCRFSSFTGALIS